MNNEIRLENYNDNVEIWQDDDLIVVDTPERAKEIISALTKWIGEKQSEISLKEKALIVIEYISLHHESTEMGDVYMAAHVANGHCTNPHEDWERWVNETYKLMIERGEYRNEKQKVSNILQSTERIKNKTKS